MKVAIGYHDKTYNMRKSMQFNHSVAQSGGIPEHPGVAGKAIYLVIIETTLY